MPGLLQLIEAFVTEVSILTSLSDLGVFLSIRKTFFRPKI